MLLLRVIQANLGLNYAIQQLKVAAGLLIPALYIFNIMKLFCILEGDQEGVMDSLLEALQTGQAFRKEGRRRAPREKG